MDLNLDDISCPGVRKVLEFARSLGVRVVDLERMPEFPAQVLVDAPDSAVMQAEFDIARWMLDHHKASMNPVNGHDVYLYTRFGDLFGARGTVFVWMLNPMEDECDWEELPVAGEVMFLHEVAHAVVGGEENTCAWETEVARVLFGESTDPDSVWVQLAEYQFGSACDRGPADRETIRQVLTVRGALPIQYSPETR